jgi:hypothetical protein
MMKSRPLNHTRIALGVLGVAWLASTATFAADAEKPHPHQGLVKPYGIPPLDFHLTPEEERTLEAGRAIRKTLQGKGGGRGLAVMDVAAPPEVVWERIADYDAYPRMVDNVTRARVYQRGGDHIKVHFELKGAGLSIAYFVDHVFRPQDGYMTWTLDYSRKSDLEDSVGFWRVSPHPKKAGHSRIFYSIDLRVGWWLPGFVERMLAKDGLVKSTQWVKREAEARAKKDAPNQLGLVSKPNLAR